MKTILLSPHNDDESLFCAYTIMRMKPLVVVVFDSYIQDWTTKEERRKETEEAMKMLGAEVMFLGLNDKTATEEDVKQALAKLPDAEVFAPTGSHKHHNMIGRLAERRWKTVVLYTTYDGDALHVKGRVEIVPTKKEIEVKNKALDCYKSQLIKNKPHFDAVRGGNEYYV